MTEGAAVTRGSAGEVFRVFLRLGLTSFGGPIAHLGYFRREFVARRCWLHETQYAELVALAQFLPGPASSQVGFAIGLVRAGWRGALSAFAAFTLPSALLLWMFAQLLPQLGGPHGLAVLHGLKLVAVAVVAQGVLSMARQLTPDMPRLAIAVCAVALVLVVGGSLLPLALIVAAGLFGARGLRGPAVTAPHVVALGYGLRTGVALAALYGGLLVLAFCCPVAPVRGAVLAAFYRAGALVFGGGHVVLPLLQQALVRPGWVGPEDFLAGYGAAQAVPGPLFSIAAFLGERAQGGAGGWLTAALGVLALFLPGLLLMAAALPLWPRLACQAGAAGALAGVNAAVVGLLAAALITPVGTGALRDPVDGLVALVAGGLLIATRCSPLWVVGGCIAASLCRTLC